MAARLAGLQINRHKNGMAPTKRIYILASGALPVHVLQADAIQAGGKSGHIRTQLIWRQAPSRKQGTHPPASLHPLGLSQLRPPPALNPSPRCGPTVKRRQAGDSSQREFRLRTHMRGHSDGFEDPTATAATKIYQASHVGIY